MFKIIIICFVASINAVEFQITNKEIGAIWVGIQGNSGKAALQNGGFILQAGATVRIVYYSV